MAKVMVSLIAFAVVTLTLVAIFSNTVPSVNQQQKRTTKRDQVLPPVEYLQDPLLPSIPPTPLLDDESFPDEIKIWLADNYNTIKTPEMQLEYDTALTQHQERIRKLQKEWESDEEKYKCFRNSNLPCNTMPDITDNIPHSFIGACAPGFVLIGTAKSGSTSLYYYLVSHPQVTQALSGIFNKEVRYFTDHWYQGTDWYLQQFPPVTPNDMKFSEDKEEERVKMINGEASPTYFPDKDAPSRVRAVTPFAKLIVLLRNPIDRTYSEKKQIQSYGTNYIADPYEDIKYQITEFKKCIHSLNSNKENDTEPEEEYFYCYERIRIKSGNNEPYVLNSLYIFQVRNWLRYFPRNQILFIKSEDMYTNPQATMAQVGEHLSLCPWNWDSIIGQIHNRKNDLYAPMSNELRSMLGEFFEEYNYMLYNEIGIDFNWENNL